MSTQVDPMPETLARFPIRCAFWEAGVVCDLPAIAAMTFTVDCGCPDFDRPACQDDVEMFAVGATGSGTHNDCGGYARWKITAHRPLHEGDLPDPEPSPPHPAGPTEPQEAGA